MVSWWPSKKGNTDSDAQEGEHVETAAHAEPTERTRLIPAQDANYLDPDDPAVSFCA
jgi:hypothetical protein